MTDTVDESPTGTSRGGVPTAAESRAFFQKQTVTNHSTIVKPASAGVPDILFPASVLLESAIFLARCPLASPLDVTRLPRDAERWKRETENLPSLAALAHLKIDRCLQLLQRPQPTDWKASRHSVGESHPHVLLDAVLDAFVFIVATAGFLDGPLLHKIRAKVESIGLTPLDSTFYRPLSSSLKLDKVSDDATAQQQLTEHPAIALEALRRLRRFYLPISVRMSLSSPALLQSTDDYKLPLNLAISGSESTADGLLRDLLASAQASDLACAFEGLHYAVQAVGEQRRLSGEGGSTEAKNEVASAAKRLASATRGFLALAAVAVPGSSYEIPAVQEGLSDAVVLSSYLTVLSVLHYDELSAFLKAGVSTATLQTIRKRIKSQSTAVNAKINEPESPSLTPIRASIKNVPPAVFVDPAAAILCRPADVEALTALWLPTHQTFNNRINPLLAWLAWEGRLQGEGEDEVLAAVLAGARRVFDRLSPALYVFNDSWTGRGDDVLCLVSRALEALLMKLKGDVRGLGALGEVYRGSPQQWRRNLFCELNKMGGRTQEALVKLLTEFAYQRCYYVCPIKRWIVNGCSLMPTVNFNDKRLWGVVEDLEKQQKTGEQVSRELSTAVGEIKSKLVDVTEAVRGLEDKLKYLSSGVLERHWNQIKQHMNLIAVIQGDIRQMKGRLDSHQGRIEQAANESKKANEVTVDVEGLRDEVRQLADTARHATRSADQIQADYLAVLQSQAEWASKHDEELKNLTLSNEDLRRYVVAACSTLENSVKSLTQRNAALALNEEGIQTKILEMRETLPTVMQTISQALLSRARQDIQEAVPGLVHQLVAEALNNSANRPPRPTRLAFWQRPVNPIKPARLSDDEVSNAEETASVMDEGYAALPVDATGCWVPENMTVSDLIDSTPRFKNSSKSDAKIPRTGSTDTTPRRTKTPLENSVTASLRNAASAAARLI